MIKKIGHIISLRYSSWKKVKELVIDTTILRRYYVELFGTSRIIDY